MKKTLIIVGTVVALIFVVRGFLIFLTYEADKTTRSQVQLASNPALSIAGRPEPDLSLKDLDGKPVSLADYKGKIVFLNFWATWCDPCRVEIPWLIDMQAKYASRGFTVVGVAMDEEGKSVVAPFISKERFDVNGQQLPMGYPILLGTDEAADKFGGILGYPTSFLISRDGKIVEKFQGLKSNDELIKAVEGQL